MECQNHTKFYGIIDIEYNFIHKYTANYLDYTLEVPDGIEKNTKSRALPTLPQLPA